MACSCRDIELTANLFAKSDPVNRMAWGRLFVSSTRRFGAGKNDDVSRSDGEGLGGFSAYFSDF